MNGEDTNLAIFRVLGEIKESLGAQNQNILNLREELFAEGGRVSNLESRQKKQDDRLWIHSVVILPLITAIHMILHKLGVSI